MTAKDETPEPEVAQIPLEKELFTWSAPSRPFKRQSREFYITALSVAVLFGLILYFIDGIMPVLLIVAFGFLFYVLSTIEPEKIDYKITSYGIRIANSLTPWENFIRFWFSERMGSHVLVLEVGGIIGRIELIYEEKDKPAIEKILRKYLLHDEAVPTVLDKGANWVARKIQS